MTDSQSRETGNTPNYLPTQLTEFIGREKEVAEIRKLVVDVRLLVLTGAPGIGKTRLALHVANDMLGEFKDGVCFVELASITDPGLVVSTIARALNIRERQNESFLETLIVELRDKRLLLVLDNFEQVVTAAPDLTDLLIASSHLKILVTSREVLRVYGEQEYQVPPLSIPPVEAYSDVSQLALEALTQYAAVHLFIKRAQKVEHDFALTEGNAKVVAEICYRLDGLPLAIELAAARIRSLSSQAILTRLESRLQLLTSGALDLPPRQRTLRGAIEWSYDLLVASEQQLFRRLAVFVVGCTLEAIEAVCNPEGDLKVKVDVLEAVDSLVSKSLLQKREGARGEPRFVLLETINEYAREKLGESAERGALLRKHAEYFMALAEQAEPHLRGTGQMEWLNRLEEEHDNLRAALRWAVEGATTVKIEIGLRTAGAIWRYWEIRGYHTQGRVWLSKLLEQSELARSMGRLGLNGSQGNTTREVLQGYRAKVLNGAGVLASRQGDYSAARPLLEESLTLRRELGDKLGIANSLNNLGLVTQYQKDYATARSLYEESLMLQRELGDKLGIAYSLNNLGNIALYQGDYATAHSLHKESLILKREIGDELGVAYSLNNLGLATQCLGDYATARSLYEESLALMTTIGNKLGIAYSLNNLGNIALYQLDYTTARPLYEESLTLKRELGDKLGIAYSLAGLSAAKIALAIVVADIGGVTRGTWVLGWVDTLLESIGAALSNEDRRPYEQGMNAARSQLGQEIEQALQKGRAMTMEQAIEYALENVEPNQDQLGAPSQEIVILEPQLKTPTGEPLTQRELEVLYLIGQGKQNKEIATMLHISILTVQSHTRSICYKLDTSSRSDLILFALRNNLI